MTKKKADKKTTSDFIKSVFSIVLKIIIIFAAITILAYTFGWVISAVAKLIVSAVGSFTIFTSSGD